MRPHHDVTSQSRVQYLETLLGFLKQRSEVHRFWKTHSSPYGCWICDLVNSLEETLILLSPPSLTVDSEGYSEDENYIDGDEIIDESGAITEAIRLPEGEA